MAVPGTFVVTHPHGAAYVLVIHGIEPMYITEEFKSMGCKIALRWVPGNIFDVNPDTKVHVANMGPSWVLSVPDGPAYVAFWHY